jgi:hypothetical protein
MNFDRGFDLSKTIQPYKGEPFDQYCVRICIFGLDCKNGRKCKYAHSEAELRHVSDPVPIGALKLYG